MSHLMRSHVFDSASSDRFSISYNDMDIYVRRLVSSVTDCFTVVSPEEN
jgi:hypothetical protein